VLLQGRSAIWHTLWSEVYSNPRYAELVPRLEVLFFAPIRQRAGLLGRLDGAVARRTRFIERRTLNWYRHGGLRLLLTPSPAQASLFAGPVVVDLDDPSRSQDEQAALRTPNIRHVIVTTESTGRHIRESAPELDITVIPQGVDLERASRARHEDLRRETLSRFSLPHDTVIVGYHAPIICVSNDKEFKDDAFRTFYADILISSIQRLWNEGLSFITVLVGKTSRIINQVARSEARLVLAGYVDRDDLFDWVGMFDIGTYPRTANFHGRQSVKLLEYMANSAAIVAMRTAETEFLRETSTGYLAADADDFCRQLRSLIISRDERVALEKRGKRLATRHDWRMLAAQYDRVLTAVAGTV
jgi:glycosyltransferase involved in cell wall biosynthesis